MPNSKPEPRHIQSSEPPAAPNQLGLPGVISGTSLQLQLQGAIHTGPLPLPQLLAGYGEIDPSFPNRIVSMAEQNAATERRTAERAQSFALAERLGGRVLAFLFATFAMLIAGWLGINGHDWLAGIIASTTIGAVTLALVAKAGP